MKDTVISTHKWSVNVRNYMENTWTRLETVPEEMLVMLCIWKLIQLQPRQQVRWNMSNGLNEFTSKRVDEMCVQVLWSILKIPPFQKNKLLLSFNLNCFPFTMGSFKKHKKIFLQFEREHSVSPINSTEK